MSKVSLSGKIAWIAVLAGALMVTWAWWLTTHDNSIAFLVQHEGAEWITDAQPPKNKARETGALKTIFKHSFVLDSTPTNATVSWLTFRTGSLMINEHLVSFHPDESRWKTAQTLPVGGWLHAGTNELVVSVTNSFGPPALWLHLKVDSLAFGSDATWLSSPAGEHWLPAHCASDPPHLPRCHPLRVSNDTPLPPPTAAQILLAVTLMAFGLVLVFRHWPKLLLAEQDKWVNRLLILILFIRAAIFIHDAPALPHETGFDAVDHEEYIHFIQEKAALPLPNDGWEMHQPPLYYLTAAVFLDVLGYSAGNDNAVLPLRMINGFIGLINCWLVLLCLRKILPNNPSAQAVGLLITSFLPANLSLSMYVANDPLAALLVTVAIYLVLSQLGEEKVKTKLSVGIGVALGAALLTKMTALLTVPVVLAVMGLQLVCKKDFSIKSWLQGPILALLTCLLVCGWHYGRVWLQIGALPLPNSQTTPTIAWWQDPGYRTLSYYLHFGSSLKNPLFSGLYSFADGIYSTLWADGLISGSPLVAFRPAWDYKLLEFGLWLAIIPTLLGLGGLISQISRMVKKLDLVALLMVGMFAVYITSILWLSLRSPWLASIKAFYALPALVPLGGLTAVGWIWATQNSRWQKTLLGVVLLVWAGTVMAAFWIRKDNPQHWLNLALVNISQQKSLEASNHTSKALNLNPKDPLARLTLAQNLEYQGQTQAAIHEYTAILDLEPDSPDALLGLAKNLSKGNLEDITNALKLLQRAAELTEFRETEILFTLSSVQLQARQFRIGLATFDTVCLLASNMGETRLLGHFKLEMAAKMNDLAWGLATAPDKHLPDGIQAIDLAQRACELTAYQKTIFVGTLAAAQAEVGKFEDAIATAQRACALAEKNGEELLLQRNKELLERYRQQQKANAE